MNTHVRVWRRFIHCITSCHKKRIITLLKTFSRVCNAIDNGRVNNASFFLWNYVHSERDKIPFLGSTDKQYLTLVVISYRTDKSRHKLVSKTSYEMTTRIRSSLSETTSHYQLYY